MAHTRICTGPTSVQTGSRAYLCAGSLFLLNSTLLCAVASSKVKVKKVVNQSIPIGHRPQHTYTRHTKARHSIRTEQWGTEKTPSRAPTKRQRQLAATAHATTTQPGPTPRSTRFIEPTCVFNCHLAVRSNTPMRQPSVMASVGDTAAAGTAGRPFARMRAAELPPAAVNVGTPPIFCDLNPGDASSSFMSDASRSSRMTVTSALLQFRHKPSRTHKPITPKHAGSDILRFSCIHFVYKG